MATHLAPEQEAKLQELSSLTGQDAGRLLSEAVDRLYACEAGVRSKVQAGLRQLDRGESLDDSEVRTWLEARERS